MLFLLAGALPVLAVTRYVKPGGNDGNTGTSWAQAYQTLQKAIEVAVAGDQIWLASGTYYPTKDNAGTIPGNGQLKTFFINKNIAIYGGFNGTESSLSQRNWRTNIAILSGDVGTVGDDADNAYHVVYIQGVSAAMRLDGVAVTKGNANGGDADDFSNPAVNGIGGGILVYATGGVTSAPTINNCRIYDNRASGGGGAGAASKVSGSSTPTFTNCLFENNIASRHGGAVLSMADGDFSGTPFSTPVFEHCTFYNNNASLSKKVGYSNALQGGGSTANFIKCILWGDPTGDYLGVASFSAIRLENSLSKGGCTFGLTCVGTVLNTDPLFVNAAGGDLRLAANSPAIDGPAGEYFTSAPAEKDYDNNNRPIGCYDYGAFETATSTATVVTCYQDMDDDGYGVPGVTKQFCTSCGEGWADNTLDCDDNQNANLPYSLNQSGTFSPVSGTGTPVTLTNDQISSALPIGFTFSFFGNNYTDFRISSNGFITFSATSSGCCSGQSIPNTSSPNNLIALAWDNLDPAAGGSIDYFTTGTAPNRKLIVNYVGIRVSGSSSPNVTSQAILYETSNLIEIHSADINGVTPATMGIENADGTVALAVPGRNSASWSATNNYVAFVPITTGQFITTFYRDMDGDGFGNPALSQQTCTQPSGYVTNNTDCDDNDALEKPGQIWYADVDNDGYSSGTSLTQCLRPVGYKVASELTATSGDCNDGNHLIHPGATETCDGVDNDCNGQIDDGFTFVTYYTDADNDGYGTGTGQSLCANPGSGFATQAGDCDDNNHLINPGATETCDGVDNNCNGQIDDGLIFVTYYTDADNDGYGTGPGQSLCADPGAGFATQAGDCNDANHLINPGATEICDGIDNNCNGSTDEGVLTTWYRDMDGDTFGNPAMTQQACAQPTGYVANNTDCNDNNPLEKPGQVWYRDTDNDGYAQSGSALTQCSRPTGYKLASELIATVGDCNDNASNVNPGATEICDGQDNNCNTITDEGCIPDYTITTTAGAIVITDISGNGETLAVSQSGGNIRFVVTPTTRTYSINGGIVTAFSTAADVALAGATSITINTAAGNDIINIGAFMANLPSLTINGGTGDETVNFNGDINFVANANLDLDMQNDHASPGVDQISVSSNTNLILSGTGAATLKVSRSLFVGSGGSLKTENGNLTLEANQQATPATGNFLGIHLDGSLVECTGSGELILKGKGGNTSAGKYGILMVNAAQVKGGTGATSITGAGGNTSGTAGADNIGVLVRNSQITSSGGGVTVNGTGGGSGSSSANYGVYLDGTGEITAGGMGNVNVTGTGGNTTGNFNAGVAIATSGAKITSSGGNVTVIGTGNGNGSSLLDYGVIIQGGGEITAGGAGTVTVEGQGGNAQTNSSIGVVISTNGKISSSAGAVYVEGTGGGSAADILIQSGGTITSTSATAGITLNSINSGNSPNASGADVSTTGTQKTTFGAGSKLNIDIDGLTANTQYQQLGVVGMIDLNGASLTFPGSTFTPAGGNTFTIVDNDGTDPVLGTFNGLAEGASIPNFLGSGLSATITYVGGTGNDVVITVISPPAPEINIKGYGLSILNGDASPRTADGTDFGNIDIFSTDPVVHTFTIQNTGTANLVIPMGGITKSGSSDFGIGTVSLPLTIAPGDSATFPVIIDASGNGLRTATIIIQSNDADESPYTFDVRAVGVSPEINVTGLGQNINSGDTTPSTLDDTDFGSVDVSVGTVSHTFTIQNTGGTGGDLYLNTGAITITGTHANDFSISGITLPDTVSPGQSVTFIVTFNPSALGTRNATIRIANNDLGESQYSFAVSGVGISPDYTITTTGNILTITDVAGNGETLNITQNGTNIRFNVTGRTYSINGGAATAFTTPADVALAGITSIVVNTATGNDIINLGAFTANLPSLTLNGGVGNDEVNFNGDITFATDANLDVDLQNDDATPGADAFAVALNANLLLSGTGTATVKVSKTLFLDLDASIETKNGNLTLEANQQTVSSTGSFIGISLFPGVVIRSANGNITLAGRGGTTNANRQHGIENEGTIATTGTGNIQLLGTGGQLGQDNDGVRNGGSISATGGGDIQLRGFSNTIVASEAFANQPSASVTTTAGDITIEGDIIYLESTSSISAVTNSVTIAPTTSGRIILLGSDDTATQLGLTDAELDRITTSTLIIGNANSGNLTVSAAISRPASTNVQLISGGDVIISGGGFNTAGGTMLLDPGTSPAAVKPTFNGTDVTASTLSFASDLQIAINGATAGNGTGSTYSQLNVVGAVNLTGVDLLFAGTYVPMGGEVFTIVVNDGSDAIIGTFTGLAEGTVLPNFRGSGLDATLSYVGGTGNDVVITVCTVSTWYQDADNDGFGNPAISQQACSQPSGYVTNNTDCDDNDVLEKPGQIWYADVDNDGYSSGTSLTQCLRPVGYKVAAELTATTGDCNDNNNAINPAATEICDGIDNNCNGSTDEGVTTTYYADTDGDGFGNPAVSQQACSQPSGYVTNNTDCDDNDPLEKPGQIWYADVDNDGYSSGTTLTQCLRPVGYKVASELTATSGDCNDNNNAINPGATEICDGIDNNCNGSTDEGVTTTYYADADNDGFGNPAVSQQACSQPSGYVLNNTDCDDNDALEKPGQTWYADVDNDGYSSGTSLTQCLRPAGYKVASELTATTGDCNDNNNAISPAATEICDGIDNNCDGTTDEGGLTTYYADADNDGFGNPAISQQACSQPSGYVANNTDCNDNDALEKPGQIWYADVDNDGYSSGTSLTQCLRPVGYKVASELTATSGDCNDGNHLIHPGATETCDGVDNDCNGQIDDGLTFVTYYTDADNDGYGTGLGQSLCANPGAGFATQAGDCDDNNHLINPGATETCDGVDNNCNGQIDDGLIFVTYYTDADNDGYGTGPGQSLCADPGAGFATQAGDCNDANHLINPAATEICDGIDNNCNGSTDEGLLTTYYADADGDGFGNPAVSQQACSQPSGYVLDNTDCDDNDALEKPGQIWYADVDNDGYSSGTSLTQCLRPGGYKLAAELTATTGDCNDNNNAINPGATEVCDGVDNNCDGETDEGCTPPMVSIHDPCTCVNNSPIIENGTTTNAGTFSETVTIEGPGGQSWTIVAVTGLYSDVNGTVAYTSGTNIPETGVGTGVFELAGYHRDGAGYTISVTNGRGDTLSIGNTCYYPDPVFTGLPGLISPNAAPFTVTGTVANNAAGTGTFILDGNTLAGAGAAPTQLTINPATLSVGTHTLVYSFDAGTPGSQNPNDPGCVQQVQQRFRVAHCGCQDVTVSLNENCQFLLTGNLVSDVNCNGGTVRVMDNDPSNGALIDCAGVWTYGLFDAFGNIICWGKVTAEDKTAPALVCAPADVTLDCYDVNYVLNNRLTIGNTNATSSPRPAASGPQTINNAEGVAGTGDNCALGLIPPSLVSDNIKNLGYAYFKDNCYNCGCRITLKWSDKVEFYSCEQMKVNGGYYAVISREWTATDCNGMRSSYVQKIKFTRPAVEDFVFNGPGEGKYDRVVEYNSCTPDKSLIKKEDVTPYVCSYFDTSTNPRCLFIDQVECNYSVQYKDTEFPICGGKGVKIDRELYVLDWCAGGIVDTFHMLIKIGDFEGPTATYADHAPYVISTGPMDCTAAIPVTVAGIKSAFGVTIKDNCNLGNISTKVYTKDRYVKGILVHEGDKSPFCNNWVRNPQAELREESIHGILGPNEYHQKEDICWEPVEYAVMNGMMIGLPVGKHLMVIDAFDGCYNSSSFYFVFEVKDKIAPIMKCDDDLHITLSNANGYTNGYAQVSAADIDEGSWDNCKLAWIAVRRNVPDGCAASFIAKGYDTNGNGKLDALPADGDVTKADGFDLNGDGDIADFGETFIIKGGKLMTPLLDYVEFFCCDLTERVTVELWGGDIYGNTNYCWNDVLIEDKVAPTCLAPWDVTIYCDDKNIGSIDSKAASAAAFGDVTIPSGNDCAALDTVYTTDKKLKCGAGYIDRIWTLTKQTAKGPISVTCKQRIHILPVHEYNICFPKDVSTDCKTPIIDTVITDELGCDILAVNVQDKRYDASDDECYKLFRTYTVINWCTYDDRCGDPMDAKNVYVVDRATFGNYGKAPLYVLVRDREGNERDGVEEFYLSKDLIHNNADDIRFKPYYCEVASEYYHSFMYTQIIKVYDDTRPEVTGIRDTFCTSPTACTANITTVVNLKDNCSDKVTLETQYLMIAPFQTTDAGKMILYAQPRWDVKDLGNGNYQISVTNLPEGTHDLIVVGRDECGNLSLATRIPFVVKDCKAPAPICINGLSTGIMPDGNGGGMMAVWATDFVASKIYDCNGQGPETKDGLKLITKYSINRVGQAVNKDQTGLNFTCADINNSPILVELHAWDEAGNHDFCITFVELIDSRNFCAGSASLSIAGTIATEGNTKLQGASITLSGSASQSATSTANGGYSFLNLAQGGDFTVTPQLDKNHLNGVSTFDLVLIQKHILGIQALNSPYKLIAADVNNSKSISTLDLIALRKLILNIDTHFANNTSWRFVDAAYQFPMPSNPWSAAFPEVVSVNDIATNVTANFIAIKVGDVNASASVNNAASAEIRTSSNFELKALEQNLKSGNEYKISFSAEDLKNIQGYQFALNLDQSKVELLDIEYGVAKAENFGVFKNEGIITTSWNGKYEPGTLFTLVLRAKADAKLSQSITLNRLVYPEAYDQNSEYLGIKLAFEGEQINDSYELKQNVPNPFNGETSIGFTLPKAAKATLTIRDVKGALVYKVEGNYVKGQNQVILKKEQLGASGVLYYTLKTSDFTSSKKMVLLHE